MSGSSPGVVCRLPVAPMQAHRERGAGRAGWNRTAYGLGEAASRACLPGVGESCAEAEGRSHEPAAALGPCLPSPIAHLARCAVLCCPLAAAVSGLTRVSPAGLASLWVQRQHPTSWMTFLPRRASSFCTTQGQVRPFSLFPSCSPGPASCSGGRCGLSSGRGGLPVGIGVGRWTPLCQGDQAGGYDGGGRAQCCQHTALV